jgi:hypothetical protein
MLALVDLLPELGPVFPNAYVGKDGICPSRACAVEVLPGLGPEFTNANVAQDTCLSHSHAC